MEMNQDEFVYTYSAPQNDEIKKIREKYLRKEESTMEKLRRLDKSTSKKGLACSLMLGIGSFLILDIGICFTILRDAILFIPGIIFGSVGIVGIALAYPLNASITKKERERLAPEILKLINELMNGQT